MLSPLASFCPSYLFIEPASWAFLAHSTYRFGIPPVVYQLGKYLGVYDRTDHNAPGKKGRQPPKERIGEGAEGPFVMSVSNPRSPPHRSEMCMVPCDINPMNRPNQPKKDESTKLTLSSSPQANQVHCLPLWDPSRSRLNLILSAPLMIR